MDKKIVHTFQQRRQLAQELDAMGEATNEAALIDMAYAIVDAYAADLVLSVLIKRLETADSHLRAGLGHICALLPEEAAIAALRAAVADRRGPPQKRVGAAVILERYLEDAPPAGAMNDLDSSNEVAFQSLNEAIELSRRNRHVLLEYVVQMRQAEALVATMVMDMMNRISAPDRVDLLRLIAQDTRPSVSQEAIDRIALLARTDASRQAVRALYTLQFVLPFEQADEVERILRKLQFSGIAYQSPQPSAWQSLVGPAGPAGFQAVWLVRRPGAEDIAGEILGFALSQRHGIRQMFAREEVAPEKLPPLAALGSMVAVDAGGPRLQPMLATPFDYGRWLVLHGSAVHRQSGPRAPMPEEYQLVNDAIWAYGPPLIDNDAQAYLDAAHVDAASVAEGTSSQPVDRAQLAEAAAALLAAPSMETWTQQNVLFVQASNWLHDRLERLPADLVVQHLQREIAALDESEQLMAALADGLRAQAAWLHYAGDVVNARRAHLLAGQVQQLPIVDNPLLARMIGAGLEQLRSDDASG